jgi:hypothetical protein
LEQTDLAPCQQFQLGHKALMKGLSLSA